MPNIQQPIINWQIQKGETGAGFGDQHVLLIAQAECKNKAEYKTLFSDVKTSEVKDLLGKGSLATRAYTRFRQYNKATSIDVIPLENPAGSVGAKSTITVKGTATETKVITLYIGDDALDVQVVIQNGYTENQIATAIIQAVNARFDVEKEGFLFDAKAGSNNNEVEIRFIVAGTVGDGMQIVFDERVAGVTLTATEFAGGTGAYDSSNILNQLQKRYHTIIFDVSASFDAIETFLENRFNTTNAVLGGVGITVRDETLTSATTFGKTKNSKTMVFFGNVDEMKINCIPILAAAEIGAKRSLRLTEGAVLGDITLDASEAYGGVSKSSLPYHNTPLSYRKPEKEINVAQVDNLNKAGVSIMVCNATGTMLGSVVTLYKEDTTGTTDTTFSYLNAVDTALAVQEYFFSNTKKEYGQTRITGGDVVAGVSMANALSVKAYIVGLYQDLVKLALVQGSENALSAFKRDLNVDVDVQKGTYKVYAPVAIVSQLRTINGVIAIQYEF